jgi:hypothetical protein
MATSLGVTLAKTLTVEPLANAANELALQKVQALVIIRDDQNVLIATSMGVACMRPRGDGYRAGGIFIPALQTKYSGAPLGNIQNRNTS